MGTFIALDLPPTTLTTRYARPPASTRISGEALPQTQYYHLTLPFLGGVDENLSVSPHRRAETRACAGVPDPLRGGGLGKFGRATDATLCGHQPPHPGSTGCGASADGAGVAPATLPA